MLINLGTFFWLENIDRAGEWFLYRVSAQSGTSYRILNLFNNNSVVTSKAVLDNELVRGRLVVVLGKENYAGKTIDCMSIGKYVVHYSPEMGATKGSKPSPYFLYEYTSTRGQQTVRGYVWGKQGDIDALCKVQTEKAANVKSKKASIKMSVRDMA